MIYIKGPPKLEDLAVDFLVLEGPLHDLPIFEGDKIVETLLSCETDTLLFVKFQPLWKAAMRRLLTI